MAPIVRFNALDILATPVFFFASDLTHSSRRQKSTVRKPSALSAALANDFANRSVHCPTDNSDWGILMDHKAVLENVRRYRTIASLCRQTAAFRPAQKWTLLEQAFEWERLAMTELDACLTVFDTASRWNVATAA